MKRDVTYSFDPDKNAELIKHRCISFEMAIAVLDKQGPLDVLEHPNSNKYGHQKIYVIELNNYIYLVPFVESENKIFLKTIFPSRKFTKKYLKEKETIDE
jgi:hypothetical protein